MPLRITVNRQRTIVPWRPIASWYAGSRPEYHGMADRPTDPLVLHYDGLILDPLMRRWYGSEDFYNVGWWSDAIESQQQASAALIDRLLAGVGDPVAAALDVGCGLGATTARVKRRWPRARVVGINLSPMQLERGRSNAGECEFLQMDATALDFPDGSFDLVTCFEAAFHFDTRAKFLREACRVLRPGGTLAVADILFSATPAAALIAVWKVNDANILADPTAYAAALQAVGFDDVRVEDATDATWRAWLARLNRWLAAEHERGHVPEEKLQSWRRNTPALRDAVTHYVLATCRKPPFNP